MLIVIKKTVSSDCDFIDMQKVPFLYVAESPAGGRGVFTAAPLTSGSLIEICPVIVCKAADREYIEQTDLYDYYFIW